jgi:uncharacterized membrane protein YgcG
VSEHKNDAPQNDWWAGIGGAVLVGVGALAIVNPTTVQSSTSDLSDKEARGVGYAFVGTGALLLAVPVIDYFRAHREAARTVERVEVPGPIVQRNVRCGPSAAGKEVLARYPGGQEVSLGRTDARGMLEVSLDDATPPGWPLPKDGVATLHVDKGDLGDVSLAALYRVREVAAWRLADSSACGTGLEEEACSSYAKYALGYPQGEHAAEAKLVLDAAAARRRLAAEEASFVALDLRACRTPAVAEMEAIETACGPLTQHLTDFPDGQHLEAVRAALRPAEIIYARLEAAEAAEEGRAVAVRSVTSTGGFIPYAGNGGGPTLCADGMMSHSSGRGTCSHHGGVSGGSSHRSSGTRSHSSGHSPGSSHAPRSHSAPSHHSSGGGRSSGGRGKRR